MTVPVLLSVSSNVCVADILQDSFPTQFHPQIFITTHVLTYHLVLRWDAVNTRNLGQISNFYNIWPLTRSTANDIQEMQYNEFMAV